jgi:ketosteroid isomerase-like protein
MRKQILFFVIALAVAVFILSLAFARDHDEKDELQKIVETGVKAINAKDMAAFEALHVTDETCVHIGVMQGEMYKGWVASKPSFQSFMNSPATLTKMENVSLKVVGDAAWGVWILVNEMVMEGKKVENPFRLTLIFERVGGKWLVSHSHASVGLPPPLPVPK